MSPGLSYVRANLTVFLVKRWRACAPCVKLKATVNLRDIPSFEKLFQRHIEINPNKLYIILKLIE